MKVIALADGYKARTPDGKDELIRKGEEFEVKDGEKATWFVPVEKAKSK
ncbi:MAG: hypothetical protein LBE24_04020 [Methylobacillus sp.]|jgi:hypothetical protein|nr:hypothetical protein [Methylobacillus sp.]